MIKGIIEFIELSVQMFFILALFILPVLTSLCEDLNKDINEL